MYPMKPYFCPQCGNDYSAAECLDEGGLRRCPACVRPRVLLAGHILIAIGLLILFGSTMILPPYVPAAGIMIGGALCITGLVRTIRRRRRRREHDGDDEFDPDDDY